MHGDDKSYSSSGDHFVCLDRDLDFMPIPGTFI
jgi:hypothetical protein